MKHVREMNRMHRVERVGLRAYGEQDKYNLCELRAKGTKKKSWQCQATKIYARDRTRLGARGDSRTHLQHEEQHLHAFLNVTGIRL